MFILKKGHQPGVYVSLRTLFLVWLLFVHRLIRHVPYPQSTPALVAVHRSITVIIWLLFVHRLIRHVPYPQSTPALVAVHSSIM